MGIKDFYKFLRNKYPECFNFKSYSEFTYKKIAIDMMNLIYIYKARDDKEWITNILKFMIKLRKQFIHPICVFDGVSHPLKEATVKKRREEREKGKLRTENLKLELESYKEGKEMGENLKKFVEKKGQDLNISNISSLEENIQKTHKNYMISFTEEEILILKKLLEKLGLDVITAENDAEAHCSYLSASDQVETVLSNDSDVFFFGCKNVLFKFSEEGGFFIKFEDILKKLEIDKEQFIDICLLCGTDFNESIKGIGFIKSLHLVKKWNRITNKEIPIYEQLNHSLLEQVRKFTIYKDVSSKFSKPINTKNLGDIFFEYGIQIKDIIIPKSQIILENKI